MTLRDWWALGLLLTLGGVAAAYIGGDVDDASIVGLGYLVAGIGGLLLAVAVIATGVRVGLRDRR